MNPLTLIIAPLILLASCTSGEKNADALAAHNTAERVKDAWTKVEKPIEIVVDGRSKEELEAIGSIGVFIGESREPIEFAFNGEVFAPARPLMADSTVTVKALYPIRQLSDTLKFSYPCPPILFGEQTSLTQEIDKIIITMKMNEVTALLRLKLESDDITDVLEHIAIRGAMLTSMRIPNDGAWIEYRSSSEVLSTFYDHLLNSGREHTYNLLTTEQESDIEIGVVASGKRYLTKVTLPPLRAGSVTELRLRIVSGKMQIGSSWVDTKHPFVAPMSDTRTTAKVGYYLQSDLSISETLTDESVGVVIESDGSHGKAVALKAIEGLVAGKEVFNTGKIYPTADGKKKEGFIDNSIESQEHLVFSPNVKLPDVCALGNMHGVENTARMLGSMHPDDYRYFEEKRLLPTAYIPSVGELAKLSCLAGSTEGNAIDFGESLEEDFLTCCESGEDTFYSVNPGLHYVVAYNSKMFHNLRTRLFYLF